MPDAALRWIVHHSKLSAEFGDAVILGASNLSYLKNNLTAFNGDKLPEDIVQAFDGAAMHIYKNNAVPKYQRGFSKRVGSAPSL